MKQGMMAMKDVKACKSCGKTSCKGCNKGKEGLAMMVKRNK